MSGYVHAHRRVLDHPAFRNQSEALAFVWLTMRASWRQTKVRYKGQIIILERGQLSMSIRDMATALDRQKGWVERFLSRLKTETMIETSAGTGAMVITICNYDVYQPSQAIDRTPSGTENGTRPGQGQDREQGREKGKKEVTDNSNELSSARALPRRPDEVGDQIWRDYKKQRKKALTETALSGIRREAAKAGISLNEALTECCERGWQGFKAEWHEKETSNGRTIQLAGQSTLRGSRPDPSLDLLRAARAAEEEERAGGGWPDHRGTWVALPSGSSG